MAKYLSLEGLSHLWGKVTSEINSRVVMHTTAEWATLNNVISKENYIYIYSDYRSITENGQTRYLAGAKIGDGTTYVVDLPFVSGDVTELTAHVSDNTKHITAAERTAWDNKVTCYLDAQDTEKLVFTTDAISVS